MHRKPLIPFGWLRAFIFVLLFILTSAASVFIARKIFGPTPFSSLMLQSLKGFTFYYSISTIGVVLMVVLLRLYVDRKPFYSLGFAWSSNKHYAWSGFFCGIVLLGLGTLSLVFLGYLKFTGSSLNIGNLFYGLILFIIVALSEEIIFRGYILHNLMQSVNRLAALFISSLVFALFHIGNPDAGLLPILSIFVAGFLLGINYIYTQNLWFGIFLHFSWNFFQGPVLGYQVSGFQTGGLLFQTLDGPPLLTGADFGLEGSLINLVFTAAAVMVFAKYYSQTSRESR